MIIPSKKNLKLVIKLCYPLKENLSYRLNSYDMQKNIFKNGDEYEYLSDKIRVSLIIDTGGSLLITREFEENIAFL